MCEFYNIQLTQTARRLLVLKHSSNLKLVYVISQTNIINIIKLPSNLIMLMLMSIRVLHIYIQ